MGKIKLTVGKKRTQQIADWMGISYSQFRKKKKEDRFKQLANFCRFQEIYGGVNIIQVYEEEYFKDGSQSKKIIKNNMNKTWNEDGLDTCKRVGAELKTKYNLPIALKTSANYVAEVRNDLFGKPYQKNGEGKLGKCTYVLCKKEGEGMNERFIRFTPEQEEIKNNLLKKYFGSIDQKAIIVKAMVQLGEIKKEEAWGVLEELTNMERGNFYGFLKQLSGVLGCKIIKATDVERNIPFSIVE